ncbi:HAMP domain-containing sensor histidine kinase [uncultured Cyclobacterium sp.]|uniref:sensor histidine kinase n=1 Tax=uncultured Cyclobacterium sp. TaxID=453820 RepID=UPI0030ED8543|tara:strand:- start:94401 stop:95705 length:1305 start_codon:yes stop_codon:yes gene_type:complete
MERDTNGKPHKLLDNTFKAFSFYSLAILILSIPSYFLVVDWIWVTEIDDNHEIIMERIENRFDQVHVSEKDLETILNTWNILQPSSSIRSLSHLEAKPDSIYEITKYNEYEKEWDRFRGLQSVIEINKKLYLLNVETNVEESYETIFAIGLITLLMYGLLVFGFIRLNKSISIKVWKPFYLTLSKLRSFDINEGEKVVFEESEIEEFNELNQTISALINQSISAYNQQKSFVANASHELQTPIALLKSKLDILLQQENLSQKHADLIQGIQIPLSRLTRVNKNLLLLAKIENSQFDDFEKVDFQILIDKSMDLLHDYIEERNIKLEKEIEVFETVFCSKFLAETLINNLLSNSIRHTPIDAFINVKLSNRVLTISNSGQDKLEEKTLFERFSISTTATTNSGLGLAILKEICKQNSWTVNYKFENSTHIFSVQF